MSDHTTDSVPSSSFSLRAWLARLADSGRLVVAPPKVALRHELAAIAKRLDGQAAVMFPRPDDHPVSVVSGFLSRREWIAEAMGVSGAQLLSAFQKAVAAPIPWQEVEDASCQQIVHRQDLDVARILPIPTHSEHDSGPYITAGMVVARNPDTGVQNASIIRIQVHAPDRMALLMLPRDLHAFYRAAVHRGEPLAVAIVIGVDPLTLLSSQAILPIDTDELEVAGALHGAALPVVKCLTSEIRVPANAEIVIEGRILIDERAIEGPFGEFPRYYSEKAEREVIAVDAITHRREPLFHTIVPAEMEHLLLGAIPREATLLSVLQKSHPDVVDVHLSVGGVCRYHLFVRLHKRLEGQPKNIIAFALGAHADIKHVVVVDDDVDVQDPRQVEWAIATRFQAAHDLVVISGARGSILDPSATVHASAGEEGISSKMGLDATRPLRFEGHVFTRVAIPGEAEVDVAALLSRGVEDKILEMLRLG